MRKFDYSFLDDGSISTDLLNLTASVYSLRTMAGVRKGEFPKVFTELEAIARIQSVKNSNAIEGIITTDERIAAIVNRNSAPLNHDEQEIAGYRDALNSIHEGYENLDFRESDILLLHRTMLSLAGQSIGGRYKDSDNVILEVDASGHRKIRFQPTPAQETAEAMQQLVLAYLDARGNARINQLLLIPCVILDFLCIHPFQDGNGRMSRLLSLLMLYKNGFDAGKYISFEEQINRYKSDYYEALRQSSNGWETNQNNYEFFIANFILTLYLCYQELDNRFAVANSRRVSKKARVEATVLNNLLPISKAEISRILPDVSPTTIEAVLGEMVRDGKIERIGAFRSSKYIRK